MEGKASPDLRLLAPVSVGVFAVAAIAVLLASGALVADEPASRSGDGTEQAQGERREPPRPRRDRAEAPQGSSAYTVQPGDTLESIALENDVTVDRLQELNPGLDPQALATGQRLKLRE